MTQRILRLATVITVALAMVAAVARPANAEEPEPITRAGEKTATVWRAKASTATAPEGGLSPSASAEETTAVARLNAYRARAGLNPLQLVGAPGAVVNHARYLDANRGVTGLDPFTEVADLPEFTQSGRDIAPQTWPGLSQTGSYSAVIDEWLADPEAQYYELLNPLATRVAFTRFGSVVVGYFEHTTSTAAPNPVVFPSGPNFNLRTIPAQLGTYYSQGCSWTGRGFPITFQWDPSEFADMDVTSAQVRIDGSLTGRTCVVNNTFPLTTRGQVVLITPDPLPTGAHVTASVQVTGHFAVGGGSDVLQASTEFTVQAPATATPGDQTGDQTGDILAVTADGNLLLYKGRRSGSTIQTVAHGFQIGRGWNAFTWFSHTPDVNGDGREDLIGRRSDGHLYLYFGQGMGSYTAGRKVGQNWGGLRNLTVVGDMSGDGTPEVIGIGPEGNLYRYTLTATGFVGASLIGKNWQGIALTASVGSFNTADNYADLIAVGTNGLLYIYYSGAGGNFVQTAVIGRGWTGFTALFSPGDLSGDRRPDLVGRDPAGRLYAYRNGLGSWSAAVAIGTGWNGIRLFG